MFERFTPRARQVVVRAQEDAARLRHGWIGKEHLLLALAEEADGPAGEIMRDFGMTSAAVEAAIERIVGVGPAPGLGAEEADALRSIGIDLDEVRRMVEESFGPGSLDRPPNPCGPGMPFTPKAKQAIELALREAKALRHNHLGTEHLLLGLVRSEGGAGAEVLRTLHVDPRAVRARMVEKLSEAS
jgi:ATP-dependent Clp protease ATP-binding subunit ClpA